MLQTIRVQSADWGKQIKAGLSKKCYQNSSRFVVNLNSSNLSENVELIPPFVGMSRQEFKITVNDVKIWRCLWWRSRDDVTTSNQKFGFAAKLIAESFDWNIFQGVGQVHTTRANSKDHL